jgi:hypothetical protein
MPALRASLILSLPLALASAPSPNIVVILADDLCYGDVKACNPDAKTQTPNLDMLAAAGLRFLDGHSNAAVCTPTRYGILTGRYTTFAYNDLKAERKGDRILVGFTLKNTGRRNGAEVAQVYVSDKESSEARPPKELRDSRRSVWKPAKRLMYKSSWSPKPFSFGIPRPGNGRSNRELSTSSWVPRRVTSAAESPSKYSDPIYNEAIINYLRSGSEAAKQLMTWP